MNVDNVIKNCRKLANGTDIRLYAEIADLLTELKERRGCDKLPIIGEKVFIVAPKFLRCGSCCADLPGDACGKWCRRWCRNGYAGYDVFETSIDRIEIETSGTLVHTVLDGYRSLENLFSTEEDARKELAEMQG